MQKLTPVLWAIALLSSCWITAVLLESEFYFTWPVKTAIWGIMLAVAGVAAVRLSINRKIPDYTTYYRRISDMTERPGLKNLLDLSLSKADTKLREAAIEQNLEPIDVGELQTSIKNCSRTDPDARFFMRGLGLMSLAVLLCLFSFEFTPAPHKRMFRFWKNYTPPNPYAFTVTPGDRIIDQNDSVRVRLHIVGELHPEKVVLNIKSRQEQNYRSRQMRQINDSTYESPPLTMVTGLSYRIRMDRFLTRNYYLGVELRPRFRSLTAVVHPPSYTGLDTTVVRYPFASIDAYPGSDITLTGTFNKPLTRLTLIRHLKKDTVRLTHGKSGLIDSLHIRLFQQARDSCSFVMVDSAGLVNNNPFAFVLNTVKDAPPLVKILDPAADLSMLRPDTVTVNYELDDDYGFHSVRLYYEIKKAFVDKPVEKWIALPVPGKPKEMASYRFDLAKLKLDPLDELRLHIEARDNDRFAGYQKGVSGTRRIRMQSMAETIDETNRREQDITGTLDSLKNAHDEINRDMEDVTRRIASGNQSNTDTRQQLDRIDRKQKNMEEMANRLSRRTDSLRTKLGQDSLVSRETLQKYDELKRLIDQIKDPALRKAIEELRKSLSQNEDALTRALRNYHFNEQLYRQKIQRTIDLFKKLRLTLSLDKMMKAADELAKREKALMSDKDPVSSRHRQEQIKKSMHSLSSDTDSLQSQSPDQLKAMMKKLNRSLHAQSDTAQAMLRNNIAQLKHPKPDMSSVHSGQKKIGDRLNRMAGMLKQARQNMNRRQVRLNLMALKNIMQDLLLLSDVQEGITRDIGKLRYGTAVFIDRARDEHNISRSFENISDSLRSLASQIPALSESITRKKQEIGGQLDRAMNALSDRDPGASKAATADVLSGMNELASMVSSLIDQLSQQPSGMGGGGMMSYDQMLKQMQQLSADQKGLNGQIQDLLNDLQGDRLSQSQINRFKQMAAQQDMIRRQIERLQHSGALEAGDKARSDLQRLSDQMNDAVNDLRGASGDRFLLNRQQNILSRMLSAESALQQRGESEKRKSETAGNVKGKPPAMTMEQLKEEIEKRRQAAHTLPFSPEYRQLIERYFKLLQQDMEQGTNRN